MRYLYIRHNASIMAMSIICPPEGPLDWSSSSSGRPRVDHRCNAVQHNCEVVADKLSNTPVAFSGPGRSARSAVPAGLARKFRQARRGAGPRGRARKADRKSYAYDVPLSSGLEQAVGPLMSTGLATEDPGVCAILITIWPGAARQGQSHWKSIEACSKKLFPSQQ